MTPSAEPDAAADARCVAALLAVAPDSLGGVVLRGAPGEARERWLQQLRHLMPDPTRLKPVPHHIDDTALLGGLDLTATLARGHAVLQPGLLARCDGGLLLLTLAERLDAGRVARLCAMLDTGTVVVEREGLAARHAARCGVVALDESRDDEAPVNVALSDRLAFVLDLDGIDSRAPAPATGPSPQHVLRARERLGTVSLRPQHIEALCLASAALGIDSLRAPWLASRAARVLTALDNRNEVSEADLLCAVRLVLAPRATCLPATDHPAQDNTPADPPDAPPASQTEPPTDAADPAGPSTPLQDRLVDAARAALPSGLLALLQAGMGSRMRAAQAGRSGAWQTGAHHGRRLGARPGEPGSGRRLDLLATLRAAAPWQALRAGERPSPGAGSGMPLTLRRQDLRIACHRQHRESTTLFVVDASGSSAMHRLAETKGAVELLLGDCYARRDRVAVLGFRGQGTELLLPPTRSLVRAKRALAGLPGGGGTPLAGAIDAAGELARSLVRRGESATLVLLTDGRANITRDGRPGRDAARDEARQAARLWRSGGVPALLLDTSPQPQALARELACEMGATYLPLPHARAEVLSAAVRQVLGQTAPRPRAPG